ncbi:MAG: sulfotransferase, partial [Magnetococcales bacterium]|nr:sulfotransferase [Magnetococcales bacterium]
MPNPPPSERDQPTPMPPLFVVGCDRSGTTLLTALLESRLDLVAPLETHFIPYFAKTLFLWGNLQNRHNRKRLLTEIYHFLEILLVKNYPQKERASIRHATLLATLSHFDTILESASSFGELIRGLFAHFAAYHNKRGWVDNSSFYESISLETWQEHLPDMKVIHIVRDGRDVVLSWLRSWWGPATLGEAASLWQTHVTDKRAWGARHPDQYLEVRYEHLLDDPETVLRQIAG